MKSAASEPGLSDFVKYTWVVKCEIPIIKGSQWKFSFFGR